MQARLGYTDSKFRVFGLMSCHQKKGQRNLVPTRYITKKNARIIRITCTNEEKEN